MNLNTLQIFDPAKCCSTGVCGPDVDMKLVQFAADLDWLKAHDVIIQRHNLSQNPAVEQHSKRTALVPWVTEEPSGPERLEQLFQTATAH